MFTASPQVGKQNDPGSASQFSQWFSRTITKLMKKENFVRNLGLLTTDTATALDAIVKRNGGAQTGTFDPFDDIYHIVYQLTMRTVGATEIADSPRLLARTLGLFEQVERNMSTTRIIFPWLPTLGYVRQTIAGGKLYVIFDKIAKERRRTGKTHEDAFQFLMDTGEDIVRILTVSSLGMLSLSAAHLRGPIWTNVPAVLKHFHPDDCPASQPVSRHTKPCTPCKPALPPLIQPA